MGMVIRPDIPRKFDPQTKPSPACIECAYCIPAKQVSDSLFRSSGACLSPDNRFIKGVTVLDVIDDIYDTSGSCSSFAYRTTRRTELMKAEAHA